VCLLVATAFACGPAQPGEDAGEETPKAKAEDKSEGPGAKGQDWEPGDPAVRVEGGELVEGDLGAGQQGLRIGVIGDSITQGGVFVHRYPNALQKLLQAGFPGAVVEAYAVPGETCGKLQDRFEIDILSRHPPYDTVIIQCGTNDLHNEISPRQIQRRIEQMIGLAQGAGMRVILLAVGPLWGHPGWTEEKELRRIELNEWIAGVAGVVPVDTATPLSVGNPAALKPEYVHIDHLHPNAAGLDEMARAIHQTAFATGWKSEGPYIRYREE
jgi:lysophospholipase L1-like esterase